MFFLYELLMTFWSYSDKDICFLLALHLEKQFPVIVQFDIRWKYRGLYKVMEVCVKNNTWTQKDTRQGHQFIYISAKLLWLTNPQSTKGFYHKEFISFFYTSK